MKKSIFVVEDNEDIREILTLILEGEQFHVVPNASISEFEEKVSYSKPDVILLDIRLPDGDGMHLCSRIKNSKKLEDVPVIMMSAHEQIAVVMQQCKADTFISKPFDIDDLLHKVQQYAS